MRRRCRRAGRGSTPGAHTNAHEHARLARARTHGRARTRVLHTYWRAAAYVQTHWRASVEWQPAAAAVPSNQHKAGAYPTSTQPPPPRRQTRTHATRAARARRAHRGDSTAATRAHFHSRSASGSSTPRASRRASNDDKTQRRPREYTSSALCARANCLCACCFCFFVTYNFFSFFLVYIYRKFLFFFSNIIRYAYGIFFIKIYIYCSVRCARIQQ